MLDRTEHKPPASPWQRWLLPALLTGLALLVALLAAACDGGDDPPAATATPAATYGARDGHRDAYLADSRRRLPTDHRGLRRDRSDAGGGARADHLLLARRNRDPLRHRGRGACRRDRRVLRLPRRDGGAAEARLLQPRAGGRPRTRAGPAAHGHAAARAGRAVPQPRDDGAVPRLGAGPRRRVLDDRPARRGHRQPPAGCRPDRVDARADRGGHGSPRRCRGGAARLLRADGRPLHRRGGHVRRRAAGAREGAQHRRRSRLLVPAADRRGDHRRRSGRGAARRRRVGRELRDGLRTPRLGRDPGLRRRARPPGGRRPHQPPGPRIVDGLEQIARLLYPDRFE